MLLMTEKKQRRAVTVSSKGQLTFLHTPRFDFFAELT
jgi:hypothetical protein